ncbi:MAG TPA: hypothetical protein VGX23_32625 [Actinocrinis sp.]|nr:hypothetical protein [Actinocrinis sp.]
MQHVSGARLGSLVLGSADPGRLAAWYQSAFAPGEQIVDSVLRLNRGALVFEQGDGIRPHAVEPGRFVLNIQVDQLSVVEEHLRSLALRWVRPAEQVPAGAIAMLRDLDGNLVNVIELRG